MSAAQIGYALDVSRLGADLSFQHDREGSGHICGRYANGFPAIGAQLVKLRHQFLCDGLVSVLLQKENLVFPSHVILLLCSRTFSWRDTQASKNHAAAAIGGRLSLRHWIRAQTTSARPTHGR